MIVNENAPGVYEIVNIITGTYYIGSAAVSIDDRWYRHRRHLRKGTHENPHLQAAWNKYGATAFQFVVLENTSPDVVIEAEQHYIDWFLGCGIPLYNICEKAGSRLGVYHTEATSRMLRKNADTFSLVAPDGTPFYDIPNLSRFCEAHGLDISSVAKVIKGEHSHYKGWRRLDPGQEPTLFTGTIPARGAVRFLTSPEGVTYRVTNLQAFCREHGLYVVSMREVCQGRMIQHRGWTGAQQGYEPKTINRRDATRYERRFIAPDGTIRITDNLSQFCKLHNLDKGAMLRLEAGKVKSHKGWRRYAKN